MGGTNANFAVGMRITSPQLFTSAKSAEKTLNQVTWTLSIIFIGLTIILSAGWLAN